MSIRRLVVSLIGLVAGITLFTWWYSRYEPQLTAAPTLHVSALMFAFGCMLLSPLIQTVRTALLFECGLGRVRRAVLVCHGVNAIAPVLGDVLEINWLARGGTLPVGQVAERCVWRSVFTLVGTLFLVGIVIAQPAFTALAVISLAVATGVRDRIAPKGWDRARGWLGPKQVTLQFLLIVLQILVEATAFLLVSIGVGAALDIRTAVGLRSVVEWTTYIPVPLSGLGVHHVGITESVNLFGDIDVGLGVQAVVHHGLWLLSSVCVGAVAWGVLQAAREQE